MSESAEAGTSVPPGACAIVVAAGRSERFGGELPKVLVPWRGRPFLAWTLQAFDDCPEVASIVLVASEEVERGWRQAGSPGRKVISAVRGGATRQESVLAGSAAVPEDAPVVLVHDGARPFVTPALVASVVAAARRHGAALPVLPVVDTVKRLGSDGHVQETVARAELRLAQTPQGFRRGVFAAAQAWAERADVVATDDVALVELALAAGAVPGDARVAAVPGARSNVKVTHPDDIPARTELRVGLGHDVHPLERGRRFVLAGVDIQPDTATEEGFGPAGHSDGDALTHAICDALLSAAGQGDIGQHFPDTAAENAGRPSLEFLTEVVRRVGELGYRPANVSAVLRLERPRLAPVLPAVRAAVAAALGVDADAVGISAKRGEGMGPVGEGRAIVCDAVALLETRR